MVMVMVMVMVVLLAGIATQVDLLPIFVFCFQFLPVVGCAGWGGVGWCWWGCEMRR
jgi:hypothetical protein